MEALERDHLRILRAIDEHGSLTAASKALGLTQPALSHSIAKLERALGVELWAREGRGLRLTDGGRHLLTLAHRLLPQFEHAEETLRNFATGTRGWLRIGMECHPCYRWLLRVVTPFMRRFPDVELDVKQKFQFGGLGALYDHEIDLLVTPDPPEKRGLEFVPVFDYEQVLVVPKGHPLTHRKFVTPDALEGETLITYPVETERLDVYAQFLLPAKVIPKARKTVEATDILLAMVESGRGVAALPGWLVDEYATTLDIARVRLGPRGLKKKIHLGLRRRDARLEAVAAFVALAKTTGNPRRRPKTPRSGPRPSEK